jgi:putative two-component system response regulator
MPASAPPPPTVPKADPTTILVVDDEAGIRQALDRYLRRVGYRVVQAEDGETALQRIADANPQAMLCDIRMPKMTGVELVPKALAAQADLAIIMLTAIDEPKTAIECLRLGAYDYLIKPLDLEELDVSLQGALRRRQLEIDRRELEGWLAREVAERTQALEERTNAIAEIALQALSAAGDWPGSAAATERLAQELGAPVEEVRRDVQRRRG